MRTTLPRRASPAVAWSPRRSPGFAPAPARAPEIPEAPDLAGSVERSRLLGHNLERLWGPPAAPAPAAASGAAALPIQRLKKSQDVALTQEKNDHSGAILDSLNAYHAHREHKDTENDHQGRLQRLADLRGNLHAWFGQNKGPSLKAIPDGEELQALYREVEAEHTEAIATIKGTDEVPIDIRDMKKEEVAEVRSLWKSIVGGTGNLRIGGEESFQNNRLADVALMLQKREGRKLLQQLNAPQASDAMNVNVQSGQKSVTTPSGQNKDDARLKHGSHAEAKVDVDGANAPAAVTEMAFSNSRDPFKINGGQGAFQFGKGTGSDIMISDEPGPDSADQDLNFTLTPRFINFGHELGHAHKNLRGANFGDQGASGEFFKQSNQNEPLNRDLWGKAEELVNVSSVENPIRDEHGLTPRKYHKDLKSVRHLTAKQQLEDQLFALWNQVPKSLVNQEVLTSRLNPILAAISKGDLSNPETVESLQDRVTFFGIELPHRLNAAHLNQANDELADARKKQVLLEDPNLDLGLDVSNLDFGS